MNEPAYRTISDVATLVGVPHHVLRFWETRFPAIAPLKRGGNRRYYRPADVALIQRIARLLHVEGYTIKGVQKLLADGAPAVAPDGVPRAAASATAAAPSATPAAASATPATASATPAGPAIPLAAIAAIRADLAAALAAARAL